MIYFYCFKQKKMISLLDCKNCQFIQYKEYEPLKQRTGLQKRYYQSERSKACDIKMSVKNIVLERDEGKCVICGNTVNVKSNSHYISRAHGGLGIEENIVTMCTEFTENKCHDHWENCRSKVEKKRLSKIIEKHLKSKYSNWNKNKLIYKKGV